jgi:O-antigen/teichoic acid export membrane protein
VAARVNQRRALVMADQGMSALSNVVVSIFVARSVSDSGFGAFGVAVVVYSLALGVCRALIGEPLLSRYSHVPSDERRALVPDMLGATLLVSVATAVVVGGIGVAVGGLAGPALVAVAVTMPLLLVQDSWRYAFIVDRPGAALAVDLAWLAGVCVALPLAPDGAGPGWFVVVWGLGAGLGAVLGWVIARDSVRHPPHPWRWLVRNRDMASRFLGEFATGQSVGQLVLLSVGAVAGLDVLGAVRAAQLFFGPINTVHMGIYLALVPEGAQVRNQPRRLVRLMIGASAVLAVVSIVWTVVGLALPANWGAELFGASWPEASDLIGLTGLAMVAGSLAAGGFAGLRALGAARASFRSRLRSAPPQLLFPLAGTALGGGAGYTLGFGLGHATSGIIYWTAFRGALASPDDTAPVAPPDAEPVGVIVAVTGAPDPVPGAGLP